MCKKNNISDYVRNRSHRDLRDFLVVSFRGTFHTCPNHLDWRNWCRKQRIVFPCKNWL